MARITDVLKRHRVLGLDTSPFIYHIEGTTPYAECSHSVFEELAHGSFRGVTSVLTLMELSVRPLQMGQPEVADAYELLLVNFPNLSILDLNRHTARRAAEIRSIHRLRPPDALQLSACLGARATAFLTNDRVLKRVTELEVLLLEDFV
ncbi:MAG: type II toxin-antitoxin system VapC family toxin [Chloroflexi bacterium]|nr:type II toxin-antitoxin system VapC family toxin [Chloroflexota bacterium]